MKFSIVIPFLVVSLFFPACAPITWHYSVIDSHLAKQQFDKADSLIKKNKDKYGNRNSVLYNLDRAMILHLAGRHAESNIFLEKAEIKIDALYTKSILTETGAMLTNDNLLPYEGEDFEKVAINIIAALNYVYLGQWDEALVEARKVDHKLNLINDNYDKKNIYKEDAYTRYLTAILYEAKGELNDAFIAYRKAYEIYQDYLDDYGTPVPSMLPQDLLRTTEALGLTEEHNNYLKNFPDEKWISQKEIKKLGEIIIFSYDGRSPIKEDFFLTLPVPVENKQAYIIRIALPEFVLQPNDLANSEVNIIGSDGMVESQEMLLMEDITAIAIKNLKDRIGRITAKAIARATAKYAVAHAVTHKVRKKTKDNTLTQILTSVGTNIFSVASEQADKRSWRTLPDKIRMVRVRVPPDTYTIELNYYDLNQRLISQKTFEVTVHAGEKKFLSNRFMGEVETTANELRTPPIAHIQLPLIN